MCVWNSPRARVAAYVVSSMHQPKENKSGNKTRKSTSKSSSNGHGKSENIVRPGIMLSRNLLSSSRAVYYHNA